MSVDVVGQVKDSLVAEGVSLVGPCGAFAITNQVALILGAKVIRKPNGTNCQERSIDGLIVGSKFVDILINAGGDEAPDGSGPIPGTGNVPAWQERDASPDELSRAVDPFPSSSPPPADPVDPRVDPSPTPDLGALTEALQGIKDALHTVTARLDQIDSRLDMVGQDLDTLIERKAPDYQGSGSVGPFNVKVNLTPKPV